jgi:hypothetical protein
MRRTTILILLIALLTSGAALANGSAPALDWWTVDAGGVTFAAGEGYSLGGTAGQPDAGLLTGAGYTLGGGFWGSGAALPPPKAIYLPLVLKQ